MAAPTVILFDVDGTLLLTAGAGRRAMQQGLLAATGQPDAPTEFSMAGMTDRAIARKGLDLLGISATTPLIDAVLEAYLLALPSELAKATEFVVLPGASALVAALGSSPAAAVGLGTGNLKSGADLKLRRGLLHDLFDFGGFGCDSESRPELIRVGAERGAARLGRALSSCRVVVIGDTPFDVRAAQVNGFECLAVATGGSSAQSLSAAGATRTADDLTDPSLASWCLGTADC